MRFIPVIEIDGSMGEGGGQILRNALSLSLILNEPVRITKIRAKRPKPGLKPQHLTSVRALSDIGNAEVKGAKMGSIDLEFTPSGINGGEYVFDTGTAGSITLMIQAILPPLLMAPSPSEVLLKGGTDVKWSPPADYAKNVFLSALSRMGARVEMEVLKRGYYPKGGGEVLLKVWPSKLRSLELVGSWPSEVDGIVHCSGLPEHVPSRIRKASLKELIDIETKISISCSESLSPGTGIVLRSSGDDHVIGADALGERGLPSEKVGESAALRLKKSFGYGVDEHLADQLLIYLSMAGGRIEAPVISSHTETGMELISMMTGGEFEVHEEDGFVIEAKKA